MPVSRVVVAVIAPLLLTAPLPADAAPEGTMTWGVQRYEGVGYRILDPSRVRCVLRRWL